MTDGEHLIIVGASARAAAFSALRAGLRPWCIDLFADADLQAKCPVMRIPREEYPHRLPEYVERYAPAGPWMFTGGLENHWRLVNCISEQRGLWGTAANSLAGVRDPRKLARFDHHVAKIEFDERQLPTDGSWLLKPVAGCGGNGIRPWHGKDRRPRPTKVYFQKLIIGEPRSALYFGADEGVRLLGVTRQLVGQPWLRAAGFAYCGTIGPVATSADEQASFSTFGVVFHREFGLRGLFGIDFIVQNHRPWVTEINPRYTAAIEVLEFATDKATLSWYPYVFANYSAPGQKDRRNTPIIDFTRENLIGKAILFAKDNLTFPADGPWSNVLRHPPDVRDMPSYADIPVAGTPIEKGHPILTFFAGATSEDACLEELQRIAAELDRWLYKS
jgi:predicted ATP-grasp superfamily ATP-dependent carboligase